MAAGTIAPPHADELLLLRLVRGELDEMTAVRVGRHVEGCAACSTLRDEMRELHQELLAERETLAREFGSELVLGPRDPFRVRPGQERAEPAAPRDPLLLARCVEASRQADPVSRALVEAAVAGDLDPVSRLDLSVPRDRFALAQALDAAVLRMVEQPAGWIALGTAAAAGVRAERRRRAPSPLAERTYPLRDLEGLASLVVGVGCNWTGDLALGERSLAHAYRCFHRGSGSELRLAQVELVEAQRRTFGGRPGEGLVLADRAEATFAAFGAEDQGARAKAARAIACGYLDRHDEATRAFRDALGTFERLGLWNAYVSVLNSLGFTFLRMGALGDARREFARALRRLSPVSQPAVRAFVRANLARVLLEAGRPGEAARSFASAANLFDAHGARLDALTARLAEAECHARDGEQAAAAAAFARFRESADRLEALDPALLSSLEAALGGETPNLDLLESLRQQAEEALRARLAARPTR